MDGEYVRLALVHLRHRPTRTMLTLVGIVIGIAAVVSLISLGQGLQDAVDAQFRALGTDKLLVFPGAQGPGFLGAAFAPAGLTDDDLSTVRRSPGVDVAAPIVSKFSRANFGKESKASFIIGIPLDDKSREMMEEVSVIKIAQGRELKAGDKYKAMVGYLLAREKGFFARPVKVGDKIEIQGKEFEVVGTLQTVGNPQDDEQIYVPIEVSKEIFDTKTYYAIYAKVRPGVDTLKASEAVKKDLRKEHGVKQGEEDFTVQTTEQLRAGFSSIFLIIQAIVVGIAAISLLVGGVGIMNTMYTAVVERTREIGIMKAVGARNSDVMGIFLVESGMLGMVGGGIGVLVGTGLSKIVEFVAFQALRGDLLRAAVTPELVIGTLLFSFIVGALSGLLPARQAAGLRPVEALRYE